MFSEKNSQYTLYFKIIYIQYDSILFEKQNKTKKQTWRIKQEYESVIKWVVVLCMLIVSFMLL